MKIVVATDKWRGSWSSVEAGEAIAAGVRGALQSARTQVIAVADGGEGTLDALRSVPGVTRRTASVTGARGTMVEAEWALVDPHTALFEIAQAAGHATLASHERDPLLTTTRGVGELVREALEGPIETVVLALGGSATVDGGAGFAQALGFQLLDERGEPIGPGGGALLGLHAIDPAGADPRLAEVRFEAWCDVRNPLLGASGAARVFGPQKGADAAAVERLERGLELLARVIERDLGKRVGALECGGAAGGLGAAAVAFVDASLASGAGCLLDAIGFDAHLDGARLVITGEGEFDGAAMPGKLVATVADRARARGIPVVLVCGRDARRDRRDPGRFAAVLSGADLDGGAERMLNREDLRQLGERAAAFAQLAP